MAIILGGKAEVLECAGCGEMYLEGEGQHRSAHGAAEAWKQRHAGCPAVPLKLNAAAPQLAADIAGVVESRLLQLAGTASLCWDHGDRRCDAVFESKKAAAAAREAAKEVGHLVVEQLELGLLSGRLEAAARRIQQLEADLQGARNQLSDLPARAATIERLEVRVAEQEQQLKAIRVLLGGIRVAGPDADGLMWLQVYAGPWRAAFSAKTDTVIGTALETLGADLRKLQE